MSAAASVMYPTAQASLCRAAASSNKEPRMHRPAAAAGPARTWSGRGRAGWRPARCAAGGANGLVSTSAGDYGIIERHRVLAVGSGEEVALTSLWCPEPATRCVVAFLTHFGDLSSTELAQKLLAVLPELRASDVGLLAVGLGEREKGRKFAELLGFPLDLIYADPTGDLYRALGFSPGFAPDTNISAYAKLLPMLAGIGSPGTIQEVLRGYIGDRSAKPVFTGTSAGSGGGSLFDVLGSGYQRPFELATLRLYNMGLVLSNWGELAPSDERLLTQQGGCIAFAGRDVVYRHADSGILRYADVDALAAAVLPPGAPVTAPTQTLRTLF